MSLADKVNELKGLVEAPEGKKLGFRPARSVKAKVGSDTGAKGDKEYEVELVIVKAVIPDSLFRLENSFTKATVFSGFDKTYGYMAGLYVDGALVESYWGKSKTFNKRLGCNERWLAQGFYSRDKAEIWFNDKKVAG